MMESERPVDSSAMAGIPCYVPERHCVRIPQLKHSLSVQRRRNNILFSSAYGDRNGLPFATAGFKRTPLVSSIRRSERHRRRCKESRKCCGIVVGSAVGLFFVLWWRLNASRSSWRSSGRRIGMRNRSLLEA